MTTEEFNNKTAEILQDIPKEFHIKLTELSYSWAYEITKDYTDSLYNKETMLKQLALIAWSIREPIQYFENRLMRVNNSDKMASCGKSYNANDNFIKTVNGIPYYYYGAGLWEQMK